MPRSPKPGAWPAAKPKPSSRTGSSSLPLQGRVTTCHHAADKGGARRDTAAGHHPHLDSLRVGMANRIGQAFLNAAIERQVHRVVIAAVERFDIMRKNNMRMRPRPVA